MYVVLRQGYAITVPPPGGYVCIPLSVARHSIGLISKRIGLISLYVC